MGRVGQGPRQQVLFHLAATLIGRRGSVDATRSYNNWAGRGERTACSHAGAECGPFEGSQRHDPTTQNSSRAGLFHKSASRTGSRHAPLPGKMTAGCESSAKNEDRAKLGEDVCPRKPVPCRIPALHVPLLEFTLNRYADLARDDLRAP